ncbi:uncharacterized protein TOT_040000957 [Theileria orientalis strain Shintoku]|uniref:Uncharacterized protein n=1 Tax=Theileria orientalis strain Shintoku TaxID=869250 RepID=J4C987_THEOR|nr:uncharacterized protein TOT_040000957 [Theileria orientalis strain Shintoku]BAM42108.1 uncharacterized protein TOT_040000957 [Theileria orientalis strain Shintoku]|eukprot:XP_009692409.1 uncharacterized protein TOT_040000957 [Theileria orientalis strain Shintoku]
MHFIKGIVDGILATDSDATHKSKHQYDPDEPEYESECYERTDGSKYRIHSNENIHITSSISHLSELYKSERDHCLNSLIIRYGEGCVQQLSELLKSNHETIVALSQQLQNNLSSLKEVNDKVESAAIEHIKLKNENNNLTQRLQQLSSENVGLKSQLTQADIAIKSNESRIASLNELLKDNKNTFENMKDRCGEFYRLKCEIEELKKKLSLSESHVAMLRKERDEYWADPSRAPKDEEYKKRILQALDREDRAVAVAKIMASQATNLTMTPKVKVVDLKTNEVDEHMVSELQVRVDKLEYENTHLKEINESLHTMYADLSKNMSEVKNAYLKESIESFTSYFPPKLKPIQLVFVQPTGVLDLEFNPESLPSYLEATHALRSGSQSSASSYQQTRQPLQSSSDLREASQPGHDQSQDHSEAEPVKKVSSKMNLRSKVINYVTNLDASRRQLQKHEEANLLNLDSPEVTKPTRHHDQTLDQGSFDVHEQQAKTSAHSDNLKSWNSDWDFFEEDNTSVENDGTADPGKSFTPDDTLRSERMLDGGAKDVGISRANYSESLSDDPFDAIIKEQESERAEQQPQPGSVKSKKGWDDVDFDDEMFQ